MFCMIAGGGHTSVIAMGEALRQSVLLHPKDAVAPSERSGKLKFET